MNRESATTRTQHAMLAAAMALITAIAAWLHAGGLHDVIAWDEANYTIAAKEGIVANALRLGELSQLRHRHAPLMCYAIAASTAVFGNDEWAIRFPAVAMAIHSCGMLVLIGFDLARGSAFTARLAAGVTAGLLLATSPASIELAGVIQPHSFVAFFLLLNLWSLCRYLRDQRRGDAVFFGLSLAGQFVTMEYGPVILCLALLAVLLARPSLLLGTRWTFTLAPGSLLGSIVRIPISMHRDIKLAASACFAAAAAVWPAGVFMLGIPFNFVFFLLYAANGHPVFFRGEMHLHVPKYAYAYWYFDAYPLLLMGMLAAIVLVAIWAWRQRGPVAITLAVFTFGLTASVHGAHIMQLCKSIFMIPAIALAGPLAALWAIEKWRHAVAIPWSSGLAAGLAMAAVLGGRTSQMSRETDPNLRLVALCQTIAAEAKPGDAVLAQGWPMVSYMLHLKLGRPDLIVHRYDPRNYEIDDLGPRLAAGEFDWAVTVGPTVASNGDCRVLEQLHAHWLIAQDQSILNREYRLYHAPIVTSGVETGRVVAADKQERETP